MDRRKFLTRTVQTGTTFVAVGLAAPAVITVLSPVLKKERTPKWTQVGVVESFPPDSTKAALIEVERADWARSLRTQLLYVRRSKAGEFEVFSRNCTDLSCPVLWDPGSETFQCPCHGGIFNYEGEPMAGPPSRPLYRYDHRVVNEVLEVDVNSVPPIA